MERRIQEPDSRISELSLPFIITIVVTMVTHVGIQARFHIPKFCRQGGQGHAIRQRSTPRHDMCYACFHRLHCNSSACFSLSLDTYEFLTPRPLLLTGPVCS